MFEPYFSTKQQGTGLGLAIVSRIVADHRGYIRVQDHAPHGTRFEIEVPVGGDASRARRAPAAPELAPPAPPGSV